MSNAELVPLFPSATHPAIPIASRILSTLRTLTAPGKGNDIKPEERAALVGVAAVLGCEKIQSHDLPTSSAQKASSVSPAHFKSALIRARRLLSQAEEVSSSNSPSSSKRTSPRTAAGPGAGAGPSLDPLSPFTTPRKKRTYTSGIDVSDLLKSGSKHAHTPATGSPLKFSSTTTTTRKEDKEEDISRTPTKRVKYGAVPVQGVDLATVQVEEGASARKRRREDTSAFMALRPDQSSVRVQQEVDRGDELPEEEKEYLSSIREKRRTRPKGSREGLKRKDWAFREGIWDSGDVRKKNEILLERLFSELPTFLESHGIPPVGDLNASS